jgi:hypothetical protein
MNSQPPTQCSVDKENRYNDGQPNNVGFQLDYLNVHYNTAQ